MLWACLHFPLLPLQITSPGDERPFAISESDVVFICNESARDSGIKPGMKLAAAFALDSRLKIFPRDEQKELAALRGIALWASQFTPTISLAPPSAVLLEIGGCFSLFGGLNRLLQKMQAGSRELGYGVVMSSASTPSAALLLARAGLELHDVQQLEKQIGPLPVTLLDVTPDILQSLEAIGMRTISDVLALPRDGLARRFGQELLDTLGKVLGNLPDPRSPFVPPAGYANKLELMTPVHDAEALLFGAKRLIGELTGFLSAKNAGVLKINLDLYHEDESVTRVPLTLSLATRDAAHLTSILRERLFNLTLPQRIEAIGLEAGEVVPLPSRNFSLFGDRKQEQENRAALIERLQARLGMGAVLKLSTFPDHRPEFAWRFDESNRGGGREAENGRRNPFHPSSFIPHPSVGALRPLWLLDRPRPLKEGEAPWLNGLLTLLSGPERIESGWWDGGDVARDYFVACDGEGAKFWIFLEHIYVNHPSLRGAVYRDEAISKSRLNRDRHVVLAMTSHERRWFLHGIFS